MFSNYLKIAWRNILKGKVYSIINIAGLAISFCIAIILILVAYFQLTYDDFHHDKNYIYQTYFVEKDAQGISTSGQTPIPLGPVIKDNIAGIESVVRIQTGRKTAFNVDEKYFEKLLTYTDQDFFQVFSFPIILGNKYDPLANKHDLVISSALSFTLFGNTDALGKIIQVGQPGSQQNYRVTAIISDCPANSSIDYDALARIDSKSDYSTNAASMSNFNTNTFIKLNKKVLPSSLGENLKKIANTYFIDSNQPDSNKENFKTIKLLPLKDVHFDRAVTGGKGAPIALIYAILALSLFIILIAAINFINLNIARSFGRAKEVGIRKTLGGLKNQIILQIWSESFIICLIGFLIGLIAANVLLPHFNARFGSKIGIEYIYQPEFLAWLAVIFFVVTFFAGGYPALKLADFNLVATLKGKISANKRSMLRSSMIVTQFALSSLLICVSVISYKQLQYLRTLPTGFDQDQVYSIPVGSNVNGRILMNLFKNELNTSSEVISVSGSGVNLGKGRDRVTARNIVTSNYLGKKIEYDRIVVDYDFLKTFNIPVIAGRRFDNTYGAETGNKIMISESMANDIGTEGLVGTYYNQDSSNAGQEIIGVFRDFDLYAASTVARPIVLHVSDQEPIYYIFLKFNKNAVNSGLEKVKSLWKELAPGNEFLGSFVSENVNEWYSDEATLTNVFGLASIVAILLSCVGLFAISLLVIELRMKEISIRLVVGAKMGQIARMLTINFLSMILVALLIAIPLAYIMMAKWLEGYRDRINLDAQTFIICSVVIMLIAALTVGFQSIRAAVTNPIKALKND